MSYNISLSIMWQDFFAGAYFCTVKESKFEFANFEILQNIVLYIELLTKCIGPCRSWVMEMYAKSLWQHEFQHIKKHSGVQCIIEN